MESKTHNAIKTFLAILFFSFSIFSFVFFARQASATTLDSYTRTPSGTSINFGTNVNISGQITADSNVDSYKIRVKDIDGVNTVYSSCHDINTDEIIFNEDFPSLAIGGYDYIHLFYYPGDNACEDDPNSVILEQNGGDEIFSIITPPPFEPSSFFVSTCVTTGDTEECGYTGALFYAIMLVILLWIFEFIYSFGSHLASKFL